MPPSSSTSICFCLACVSVQSHPFSVSVSLSLCLSVSLSFYLFVSPSFYLFVSLSVSISVSLCVSLCLSVSLCPSVPLSLCHSALSVFPPHPSLSLSPSSLQPDHGRWMAHIHVDQLYRVRVRCNSHRHLRNGVRSILHYLITRVRYLAGCTTLHLGDSRHSAKLYVTPLIYLYSSSPPLLLFFSGTSSSSLSSSSTSSAAGSTPSAGPDGHGSTSHGRVSVSS